jgi:hypothetical protein
MDTPTPPRPSFRRYVSAAIRNKWNLLLFGAGAAFAALSPFPDALVPIILGVEGLVALGLASHPRFQQAVDAQLHKANRTATAVSSSQTFLKLLDRLDPRDRTRFRQLVSHCEQMQDLASGVGTGKNPADDMRQQALNRLLFFHLRLLITRDSLLTFLEQSNLLEIKDRQVRTERQLATAKANNDARLATSLEDTLKDLNTRIANLEKAEHDAKFIDVELERIEGKAQALAESAIARQDPTELAAQVTAFTDTLKLSEDVEARMVSLKDLELTTTDAPMILNSAAVRVRE